MVPVLLLLRRVQRRAKHADGRRAVHFDEPPIGDDMEVLADLRLAAPCTANVGDHRCGAVDDDRIAGSDRAVGGQLATWVLEVSGDHGGRACITVDVRMSAVLRDDSAFPGWVRQAAPVSERRSHVSAEGRA